MKNKSNWLFLLLLVTLFPIACSTPPGGPTGPAPVTLLVTPTYSPTFPAGTLTMTSTPVPSHTPLPTARP